MLSVSTMNMETRTPRVSSPVSQVQEASTEPPSGFILKLYEMIQGAADNIISVSLRCRSTVPFVYFEYRLWVAPTARILGFEIMM